MKKLKLYNGRFERHQHIFICAHSDADAGRILAQAYGNDRNYAHEIKKYFAKNCWGNTMNGVTPERGAWVSDERNRNEPPKRII